MKLLNWSCQKIHCSVDDTLWIFKDLTEHKEYVSIFENPILNEKSNPPAMLGRME